MGILFDTVTETHRVKTKRNEKLTNLKLVDDKSEFAPYLNNNGAQDIGTLTKGVVDSQLQHRLEEYDLEREKLILESDDIVKAYSDFIDMKFEEIAKDSKKNLSSGDKKWLNGLADNMVLSIEKTLSLEVPDSNGKHVKVSSILTANDIKKALKEVYIDEKLTTPEAVRAIILARQKYCEATVKLLQKMISLNYDILGIDKAEAEAISSGLENPKTMGYNVSKIKELVSRNEDKFVKGNKVDLRPLGGGVAYFSSEKEGLEGWEGILSTKYLLQTLLYKDMVFASHGVSVDSDTVDAAQLSLDVVYKFTKTDEYKEFEKKMDSLGGKHLIKTSYSTLISDCNIRQIGAKSLFNDSIFKGVKDKFFNSHIDEETFKKICKDVSQIQNELTKQVAADSKNLKSNPGKEKWYVVPIETDGGKFVDINKMIRWGIKDVENYRKANNIKTDKPITIEIKSCNPGKHLIAQDLIDRKDVDVKYTLFSNVIESYGEFDDMSLDAIYEMAEEVLESIESNIQFYDVDDFSDVMEASGNKQSSWVKAINLIKKFLNWIAETAKRIVSKIREGINKIKQSFIRLKGTTTGNKKIETSYIALEGAKVVDLKTTSIDEIEKRAIASITSISKELEKQLAHQKKINEDLLKVSEKKARNA